MIGWAKNLGITPDQALYDYSYKNLLLFSAATPQFDDEEDKWDSKIDANDPGNFRNESNDNEEFVKDY